MDLTRRRLLSATAGAAGAGLLAGCIDGAAGGRRIGIRRAGGTVDVLRLRRYHVPGGRRRGRRKALVPLGQHGHGWEPGPNVREDIHGADLLVHGMPEFQPWVDGITADLEADGSDVATVDMSSRVDLLGPNDHPTTPRWGGTRRRGSRRRE